MNKTSQKIEIKNMQAFQVPAGKRQISCLNGAIWLTSEGCINDIILESGMQVSISSLKNVYIQGLAGNVESSIAII
jgi:hypothetical protein